MDLLDFVNHLLNFLLPGLGTGLVAAGLTKLLWRRDLAGVPFLRLASYAIGACVAALVGGLVISGRDGLVDTYLVMVVCCALALAWAGWTGRTGS